jgi:hypothetical protein
MGEYTISWVDISYQAYADLAPDRQDALNARLVVLARNPTEDAVLDHTTGWWTTTYAHHTGLLLYGISERQRHLVILRLQDLGL